MSVSEAKRAAITRYNEKCGRIELRPLKEQQRRQQARARRGIFYRPAQSECNEKPENKGRR